MKKILAVIAGLAVLGLAFNATRALADDKEVTIKGNAKCAACSLHEGKECTTVIQTTKDGKTINWDPSLAPLPDVLKQPSGREIKAQYATKPAKVTTDAANAVGIKEVIGEFSTSGFGVPCGATAALVCGTRDGLASISGLGRCRPGWHRSDVFLGWCRC